MIVLLSQCWVVSGWVPCIRIVEHVGGIEDGWLAGRGLDGLAEGDEDWGRFSCTVESFSDS